MVSRSYTKIVVLATTILVLLTVGCRTPTEFDEPDTEPNRHQLHYMDPPAAN